MPDLTGTVDQVTVNEFMAKNGISADVDVIRITNKHIAEDVWRVIQKEGDGHELEDDDKFYFFDLYGKEMFDLGVRIAEENGNYYQAIEDKFYDCYCEFVEVD